MEVRSQLRSQAQVPSLGSELRSKAHVWRSGASAIAPRLILLHVCVRRNKLFDSYLELWIVAKIVVVENVVVLLLRQLELLLHHQIFPL